MPAAPVPSIRLSCLLRELHDAGFALGDLTYRKLWEDAVAARFPAHQVAGRWHFHRRDVPTIASAYGLVRTPCEEPVAA
jgi:hypothetical protein